jgi:hypothetical protein
VRTDLTQLGFPQCAFAALNEHETTYKDGGKHGPQWFNTASNYLDVTKQALQFKLKACSDVMLMDGQHSSEIRSHALEVLLDPHDAMALEHGIVCVMKCGLHAELEKVSESEHLQGLSLKLKNAGLVGPIPDVLLRICAKTTFFDLSGNNFDFPDEEEGGHTYLRDIVEHVHNCSDQKRVELRNTHECTDLDGLQHYAKVTQLAIGGCGAIKGAERISRTMKTIKRLPELIDLDISGSGLSIVEAEAFGQALARCAGGLQKFVFSGNEGSESVTMATSMTEADCSGKALGASGTILLSAFLPKCT